MALCMLTQLIISMLVMLQGWFCDGNYRRNYNKNCVWSTEFLLLIAIILQSISTLGTLVLLRMYLWNVVVFLW